MREDIVTHPNFISTKGKRWDPDKEETTTANDEDTTTTNDNEATEGSGGTGVVTSNERRNLEEVEPYFDDYGYDEDDINKGALSCRGQKYETTDEKPLDKNAPENIID